MIKIGRRCLGWIEVMKMNKKLKEWMLNCSLILGGIMIFFIILEIGLALNIPFLGYEGFHNIERGESLYYQEIGFGTSSNRVVEHTTSEYRVIYHFNSFGFRDKEHTLTKDSNTLRIVVLGDSFSFAQSVPFEQSFPYLLEQKLNSNPSIQEKIEIINLGMWGFGTDREYLTLKYIGLMYHPDLVILAFYTGNDVRNNYVEFENRYCHVYQDENISLNMRPFFIIDESGELEELPFQVPAAAIASTGNEGNDNGNLIFDFLKKFRSPSYLYSKIKDFQRQKVSKGYKVNGVPIDYYVYAPDYSADWQEAWNITKALILKVDEKSKEKGAQLLLVSLTDRKQVHNEYWQKALATHPEMNNMYWDLEKPEKILTDFSAENNINYLPLLTPFKEYVNRTNEKVHGHYDGHWNANGHKLAAELIYKKLIEDRLISLGGEEKWENSEP